MKHRTFTKEDAVLTAFLLAVLLLPILCSSCATRKPQSSALLETASSTVEVRRETVSVPDTVYVEIPSQSAYRETRDSTSHLENDFAVSDAKINSDGTLSHDLKTKPQKKPVSVDREIERMYVDRKVKVPYPVERKLTLWQQTCIKCFPYLLGMVSLILVYFSRKPILSMMRRFI